MRQQKCILHQEDIKYKNKNCLILGYLKKMSIWPTIKGKDLLLAFPGTGKAVMSTKIL